MQLFIPGVGSNRILLIAHAPLAHAMQQCAAHVFPDSDAFLMALDIAADAETLARRLIEEAGVAATPGLDFGHHLPHQHLRIAYTTRRERLLEAVERIARLQL